VIEVCLSAKEADFLYDWETYSTEKRIFAKHFERAR